MTPAQYLLVILAVLVLGIFLFSVLKGIIKMILLAIAITCAIACWLFIQRNGIPLLSIAITEPETWMVDACSYIAAIFVFFVFFHGLSWFSNIFSFRKASSGSIITTTLMSVLMVWIAYISFSYASNRYLVKYYHDCSLAQSKGEAAPSVPLIVTMKQHILETESLAWLEKIDPLDSAAQTKLASLIAYGCTLTEQECQQFYNTHLANSGIVSPYRFQNLFKDVGLRQLVEQGNFASLLENELLQSFLQLGNSNEFMEQYQFIPEKKTEQKKREQKN